MAYKINPSTSLLGLPVAKARAGRGNAERCRSIKRRKTKSIKIGNISIGGNHPILIQSMVKAPTKNIKTVLKQINGLENAGCEIIRVAVKDKQDAKAISKIKRHIRIPIVADIHFNYKFALEAIDSGVDKIRLNPGNIFKKDQIKEVAKKVKEKDIPIRVGVNSGSLRQKYSRSNNPEVALIEQARDYIRILKDFGIDKIVISLKSSNIGETINAYRKISKLYNYPLHLGVTATGLFYDGIVKSSLGIGLLLLEGIGDTIRVSLLEDPLQEIRVAKNILSSLGIRRFGPDYICCPTCGRCEVDLRKKARELALKLENLNHKISGDLTIALMGCMVNGPGEAKNADIGIAFGKKKGILFKKGRIIDTIDQDCCVDMLVSKIKMGV